VWSRVFFWGEYICEGCLLRVKIKIKIKVSPRGQVAGRNAALCRAGEGLWGREEESPGRRVGEGLVGREEESPERRAGERPVDGVAFRAGGCL